MSQTDDGKLLLHGLDIHHLTSKFASSLLDPITVAVSAGGGKPFKERSCLAVLTRIHEEAARPSNDPTAVDAMQRDGNLLESFGGVVVMLTSWSHPDDILSTISFHCGREVKSKVMNVLERVQNQEAAEGFRQVLTSCFSNLVPLRIGEEHVNESQAYGCYMRCKNSQRRDGIFYSPVGQDGSRRSGGAEFKNRRQAVSASQLKKFVKKLSRHGHDLLFFMAPELRKFESERILPCGGKESWLLLHWRKNDDVPWHTFHRVVQGAKRYRVLILMELGLSTDPFGLRTMHQDALKDEVRLSKRMRASKGSDSPSLRMECKSDKSERTRVNSRQGEASTRTRDGCDLLALHEEEESHSEAKQVPESADAIDEG